MPDTTPTLRDRIAEALAAHDGLTWGPGRSSQPSGVIEDYHHRADAVLSVLRRATQPEIKAATVPARLVLGTTDQPTAHRCDNCEGIDPDTCFNNPHRPPEQCPAAEFEDYGQQCQNPAGHELHTFEEQPPATDQPDTKTEATP